MASPRNQPHTPQPIQAPASSIQSAQSFDRELTAQMQVLLTQLGEVERKGLLMFHKIEESFKHPYTQSEAMADTANLLAILDTLIAHSRSTGFGALSMQQLSAAAASGSGTAGVPGLVSAASTPAGTTTFTSPNSSGMTPRMMQTSIHGNSASTTVTASATHTAAANSTGGDTIMTSPAPLSGSMTSTPTAMIMSPPPGPGHATVGGTAQPPSSQAQPSATTPSAMSTCNTPAAGGPTTPQASAGNTAPTPGESASTTGAVAATNKATVAQLIEARQTNVQTLYAEKAKLKQQLRAAITMVK
ncbi:hypothetical protein BGW41_005894 [Actinomortierella wolfii]|nr:hypothetical protein BGW41_005894 [Actinomortierella wolfii]